MTPIYPRRIEPGAKLVCLGADQPQYLPLPAAVSPDGVVMTEWELSAEELAVVLRGGRVRVWTWTFGQPFQPVRVETSESPSEDDI